jgi:transposase
VGFATRGRASVPRLRGMSQYGTRRGGTCSRHAVNPTHPLASPAEPTLDLAPVRGHARGHARWRGTLTAARGSGRHRDLEVGRADCSRGAGGAPRYFCSLVVSSPGTLPGVYSPSSRRRWLSWHAAHGRNVAATCRRFGISRSTLYRWLQREREEQLLNQMRSRKRAPLRDRPRSGRPRRHDHAALLIALARLELVHPRWGRSRMHAALVKAGWQGSAATVGRLLRVIRVRCPECGGSEGRHEPSLHALRADVREWEVLPRRGARWPV